jgi:hypothetical protein
MLAPAVLLLATASLSSLPAQSATAETGQSAVWTSKELHFVYMGFTTKYSCDGLRDKVRDVLIKLGAQRDLKVYETGCSVRSGMPAPFPGVMVRMSVLEPASTASSAVQEPSVVRAHWKPLDLKLDRTSRADSGECELVEQIKQQILPLFAVRNVDFSADCVPHQLSPMTPRLRAEILAIDQSDARPSS